MKFQPLANHVLRDHVLIGGAAAGFLVPLLGIQGSFLFWAATILVDLDHYLHFLYCVKFKHVGIAPLFRFHEELFQRRFRPELLVLEIFHTLEFIFLMGFLAFGYAPFLIPVFWGIVFHMAVDFVHLWRHGILEKRPLSVWQYYWKKRKLSAQGLETRRLIAEVLAAAKLD